jgi:hypothetical protein
MITNTGILVDTELVSGLLRFGEDAGGWTASGLLESRAGVEFPVVVSASRLQVMLVNVCRELGRVETLVELEGVDD